MCRFVSVDPLAREYPFYTPYQYAGNQPIISVDIDGLEGSDQNNGQGTSGEAANATTGGAPSTVGGTGFLNGTMTGDLLSGKSIGGGKNTKHQPWKYKSQHLTGQPWSMKPWLTGLQILRRPRMPSP
jgi:hypothetical protein